MSRDDEQQLIERCKAGDQRAFRVLVETYQRRVYSVAYGVLRNHDQSMDATQDAFVKVFRYLPKFKGDSSFYTWMYRIVVNVCIDKKRKAARQAEVDYDDTLHHSTTSFTDGPTLATVTIDGPGKALARKELRQHMNSALDKLSDAHREILLLREVEGLSYEEIAEILDIAKGTVMSRLFHARKNFQKALGRYLGKQEKTS